MDANWAQVAAFFCGALSLVSAWSLYRGPFRIARAMGFGYAQVLLVILLALGNAAMCGATMLPLHLPGLYPKLLAFVPFFDSVLLVIFAHTLDRYYGRVADFVYEHLDECEIDLPADSG